MKPPKDMLTPGIAKAKRVSDEFMIAEAVIDFCRPAVERSAIDLGLLDRGQEGWRRKQALAELMGGLMLARAAGCGWPEIVRLARVAAIEVRSVELRRVAR